MAVEKRPIREAPEWLGISIHAARRYRRRSKEDGLAVHLESGTYDITGKGEIFLSRWGNRNPAPVASSNPARGTDSEDREDLTFWEVHNTRFTLPILRASRPPPPSRTLRFTPIASLRLEPPHPQDPGLRLQATLEIWGKEPKAARFYVRRFPVLGSYRKILLVQEDVARAAIREAKETAQIGLPRTPAPENWHEDPLAVTSLHPLPSGHARLALPEFKGILRPLLRVSPTAIMDHTPGPGWETGDLEEGDVFDRLLTAIRLGRIPEDLLALKEGQTSLRQALLTLARRQDRGEDP